MRSDLGRVAVWDSVSGLFAHDVLRRAAARPELRERDFFVTGESYAGHYIPVVTHHIWRTNKAKPDGERINLAGMAIGNGMCVCRLLPSP